MTVRRAPDQDQTAPAEMTPAEMTSGQGKTTPPPATPPPATPPPATPPQTTRADRRGASPCPADRLLAEAVRACERDGAAPVDEPAAEADARAGGGDFETRLVRRAAALSGAADLRRALRSVQHVIGWTITLLALLALLAGAGAVRAALGAPDSAPVNFFLVFTSLLGLQTLLLLFWIAVMIGSSRSSPVSPLGGAALALGRWLATRGRHDVQHLAAVKATSFVFARGAVGRWTLSAISHGLWLAFNVGCVGLLIVLLTTKQYTFNWETTILSAPAYERITQAISAAPTAAGFTSPTSAQIAATQKGAAGGDPAAARAWSGLLVGSILLYGFGPRVLLLGASLSARRRALRKMRLDTTAPGFRRLRPRLMFDAEGQGVVDIPQAPVAAALPELSEDDPEAGGRPVVFGLEIDPPAGPWPPALHAVRWIDLGFVDGREDRRRVRDELTALPTAPRMTVVVCAMTTTPDRGLGAFLDEVGRAARGPVALLLTGGHELRQRASADRVAQRSADWLALADGAGITEARVLEIDLEHLTETSRQGLANLLGAHTIEAGAPAGEPGRKLESAFALIAQAQAGGKLSAEPGPQAELHRRVARLYANEAGGLRERLGLRDDPGADLARSMKDGAKRLVDRLPGSVRQSPKWLAAGATAGALGCIAIGTLVTPVALAAIPAWSLSGAGLAGLVRFAMGDDRDDADAAAAARDPDAADALRAVTLFALLLELQGRSEAVISRVLESTLTDDLADAAGAVSDGPSCTRWLDDVRHGFDLALAGETAT